MKMICTKCMLPIKDKYILVSLKQLHIGHSSACPNFHYWESKINYRYHPECRKAMTDSFSYGDLEEEFEPQVYERGKKAKEAEQQNDAWEDLGNNLKQ